MQYSQFRFSPKPVSRIGFGAMGIGTQWAFGATPEEEAIASLLHSWERGVTLVDTARGYGDSEIVIGKALREWRGDAPFIATKVAAVGPKDQWAIPPSAEVAFPKGHITASAETSLQTLGVEQLDLLQLHLYWANWGVGGYWLDELNALKASGKVAGIGVSLPDQRCDVGLPLAMSGVVDSLQVVFNLFDPYPLDCLIPLAQENGVGIIARCVLDESGLTGAITRESRIEPPDYRAGYFEQGPLDEYVRRVDALRAFIPSAASSLASLALKFALYHPGVTSAISSMHVRRYADENISAADEPPLTPEVFDMLRRHHRWAKNFYGSKVL